MNRGASESEGRPAESPRLDALVEQSPALIAVLSDRGEVRYTSPAAVGLLTGRSLAELSGDGALELIHPDDVRPTATAFVRSVRRPGTAVPVRFRNRHADGCWHFLEGTFVNRLDDPRIDGIVLTVSDVTDAVRAREELEERLAVEAALTAISRAFLDHGIEALDASAEHALGVMGRLAGADRAWVCLARHDLTRIEFTHEWCSDPRFRRTHLREHPTGEIQAIVGSLARLRPVVVHLARADPRLAGELRVLGGPRVGSVLMAPLVLDGLVVGSAGCDTFDREHEWTPAVVAMFEQFATLLVGAVERREAEAGRRRSERRLHSLVQGSPDLIAVVDDAAVMTFASPGIETIFGFRPEEWVGRCVLEQLHPDDVDGAFAALTANFTGGKSFTDPVEFRVRHADGRWVTVEAVGYHFVEDGEIRGIVMNVRDITERKRIEARLREAQARFEEAWQHAPIGMCMVSLAGRIVRANPALASMLGRSEEQMVGLVMRDLADPDDVVAQNDRIPALLSGERSGLRFETRFHRVDGEWIWSRVSVSLVRDADGAPLYGLMQIEDVSERRRIEEQLAYDATHDALTGLPSRNVVLDHLAMALAAAERHRERVAVLFVDLDNFKRVNDSFGHAAGDELLRAFARRLGDAVRTIDTAGRLGGDEFAVVCPELEDATDVVGVARRILGLVEAPFQVGGVDVFVGASIGIAVAHDGTDAASLLRQADTAAYRAKERGRNRYEIFDDELRAVVASRLETEAALRRAIEQEELCLWYQPIVDSVTAEIVGFEGLVRWDWPGRGIVAPSEFLGIAEETGLIVPLGARVTELACGQLAAWTREFGEDTPGLSLNLSARQLVQADFAADVRLAIGQAGVDPHKICLEITETILMQDTPAAIARLEELRGLGVALAIDDFGTGYSSLSYLRRLPVDVVKIDRAFVLELGTDHEGSMIVAAVINLAHALGMQIVAEGVETIEGVAALVNLGCDRMQGFYFARPLPAADATALLRRGRTLDGRHGDAPAGRARRVAR